MSILDCVRTGSWLDEQRFPPLRWAVPGLMPEGFGLVTGPPKAGKSWAALGIALAVAAGDDALGVIPTGPARPVLMLALEDGDRRLQSRCRTLLGEAVPIPDNLHHVTAMQPGAVVTVIDAWLDEYGDAAPLVILDTLGRVMPPALPGEGAYQRDYRVGAQLKRLVDTRPGSTLAVVHHVRKQTGEDWMDSTSGTNGLNGAADWTMNLARPRNEDTGVLRITGRDVPENEYAVTCHAGEWRLDGADLDAAAATARQRAVTGGVSDKSAAIIAAVNNHPGGAGPTLIAAEVDMEPKHVGTYLGRLADAGRLRRLGRGLYAGVESVESVETPGQETLVDSTVAGQCGNGDSSLTSEFHRSTLSTHTTREAS